MLGNANVTERNIDRIGLLETFQAILQDGSLVAAAKSRQLTQSAVSKHLSKLRTWLGDPLFVQTSEGMTPTRKALELVEPIDVILKETGRLTSLTRFAPSELTGVVTIATTDEVRLTLLRELAPQLARQAPKVRLSFIPLESDYSQRQLETGQVDLVISVNWHAPPHLVQKKLFTDKFVCALHAENPLAKKKLTLEAYSNAPHIVVAPLGKRRGILDDYIAELGQERFIRLSVPDFADVSADLLGRDALITLPERVVCSVAKTQPIVKRDLPLSVPPIVYYMFWHARFSQDRTSQWLRGLVLLALHQT